MDIQLFRAFEPYFKIGSAVNIHTVKSHCNLIKKHFNLIVCENEMKYSSVMDNNGKYDFSGADAIYNFAEENNIEMHTHTFVWHQQTPESLFSGDRKTIIERLAEHMRIFNERYPDITTVDIVNEAIDDKNGGFLRKTKWLEKLGENYIYEVFSLARSINPNWKLIYNDYNEYVPEKREKIIKLVKSLKSEGVIDGIGFQSHLNIAYPTYDDIKRSFDEYSKLDMMIRISELDVSLFRFEDKSSPEIIPHELIKKQTETYRNYLRECIQYHELIDSVTFWGTTDESSWLNGFPVKRNNPALLFDRNENPKEAFYAICELL